MRICVVVTLVRVAKLKELGLIFQFIFLNQSVNPVWCTLVNLLKAQQRFLSDRLRIKFYRHESVVSMVDQEVERAQVLYLLV